MLRRHSEILDVTELLLQELAIATRDDKDDVLGIRSECLERREEREGGRRGGGILDDRSESSICEPQRQ